MAQEFEDYSVVGKVVYVEDWKTASGSIKKIAVRVAKGNPGAGRFDGITNVEGTVFKYRG